MGKEGASRNHLRKKRGRERPMAQHSERRRRIAGRNVVVKQFVECLVISGEQQSGLLRNSGGGTGLRFLTAPNWLLPASVRSLARLLLTSSLLLPTCIQCPYLGRIPRNIGENRRIMAKTSFFLLTALLILISIGMRRVRKLFRCQFSSESFYRKS